MACVSEQGQLEVCYPVYHLESQQFFMNRDGRMETMTASEQKIVFTNNLQDGNFEIVHPEHISEESVDNQLKKEILSVEINEEESFIENNSNDFDSVESESEAEAEAVIQVMLDDNQCLTLERKGRVLLEQDSRFFLLDNIGLQEITKQNDFIEQLREEHLSVCRDKKNDVEMLPETIQTLGAMPELEMSIQTGESDATIPPHHVDIAQVKGDVDAYLETHINVDTLEVHQSNDTVNSEGTNRGRQQHRVDKLFERKEERSEEENVDEIVSSNDTNLEPIMTICMDYVIKELPPKLYIGQSNNGKKLHARLRKLIPAQKTSPTSHAIQKRNRLKSPLPPTSKLANITTHDAMGLAAHKCLNSVLNTTATVNFDEKKSQACKLIDEAMSSDPEDISYLLATLCYADFSTSASDEHLASIEKTVDSLMQLASVKKLLVGQNVIVTKVMKYVNGEVDVPFVVTGFISDISGEGGEAGWRFVYMPELLMENSEEVMHESVGSNKLLHIAIVEKQTATPTPIPTTNVLVVYKSLSKLAAELQNKKQSQSTLADVRRPTRLRVSSWHACAACGATFTTETELGKHQETHKLEVKTKTEPDEMIEGNEALKVYENSRIVLNEQQCKMFVCYYCKKVFTRCSNLQRHMSIHYDPVVKTPKAEPTKIHEIQKSAETLGQSKGVFTCSMCTCSYFYASTLTRHIMTCHIDPTKTNKHTGEELQQFE